MRPLNWLLAFGLLGASGHVFNFDGAAAGKLPSGWTKAPSAAAAQWEIHKDASAPTQPYVLAQASSAQSGAAPLVTLDSPGLREGEISVRVKPVGSAAAEQAGIVFGFRDEQRYYLVEADARASAVGLFRVESGRRTQLVPPARHDMPLNVWRILKVSVSGARIQVYVDHRRVLQAEDRSYGRGGKVGLWTAPGAVTHFDDLRLASK